MSRIDRVLDEARERLRTAFRAATCPQRLSAGAVLVDIRPQAQREREGGVAGRAGDRAQRTRVALRPDQRRPPAAGGRRRRRVGGAVL